MSKRSPNRTPGSTPAPKKSEPGEIPSLANLGQSEEQHSPPSATSPETQVASGEITQTIDTFEQFFEHYMMGRVFAAGGGLDAIHMMPIDKTTNFMLTAQSITANETSNPWKSDEFPKNGTHNYYYRRNAATKLTYDEIRNYDAVVSAFDDKRSDDLKSTEPLIDLGVRISKKQFKTDEDSTEDEKVKTSCEEAWLTLRAAILDVTTAVYACGLVSVPNKGRFYMQISEHGIPLSYIGDDTPETDLQTYSTSLLHCLQNTGKKRLLLTDNKPDNLVIVRGKTVKVIDLDSAFTKFLKARSEKCVYYINAAMLLIFVAHFYSPGKSLRIFQDVSTNMRTIQSEQQPFRLNSGVCKILTERVRVIARLIYTDETMTTLGADRLAQHVHGMIQHYLRNSYDDPQPRFEKGKPLFPQLVKRALETMSIKSGSTL